MARASQTAKQAMEIFVDAILIVSSFSLSYALRFSTFRLDAYFRLILTTLPLILAAPPPHYCRSGPVPRHAGLRRLNAFN
ncbi:MAG TPA: hypothetical protein VF903_00620 [Nitrospirota bacterium]